MWEQIRSNQRRSIVLALGMGLLLLAIGYILGLYFLNSPAIGLIVALLLWAVMNLIALFQGDNIMLSISKARKINQNDSPRLYNIVEEMKIASGLENMPDIYVIDDPAPNAFATGRSLEKSAVAVTSGLLQRLNRDELQGVIGHEISHIKNRDVLLMTMCSILLGTIVILSWYASRMLFFSGMTGGRRRSSTGGGGAAQLIILAVAIALMILAPIMAQLIYFAISRKREYLADASSAQYTRYPEGLAAALEKISASTTQLKTANKATAPMYIINPFRKKGIAASELSSTHPPISERIRILRSMVGGASFADYDNAYRKTRMAQKGVVPSSTLAASEAVAIRNAEPQRADEKQYKIEQSREISDLLWRQSNYQTIRCECGTRFRIPPGFKATTIRCPHCGIVNKVNQAL
jgi:heat shock protein HtpX